MEGDWNKKSDYARQWYATQSMAPSLLYLANNMLESVDRNYLFTDGEMQPIPCGCCRKPDKIRPDVTVINLSLASNRTYSLKLIDHRHIRIDLEEIERVFDQLPYDRKRSWMIRHLEQMNPDGWYISP